MIYLTRLNQAPVVVNADLIEHIEMNPDTVIALTNGQKILVRESAAEIVEKVIEFRRRIVAGFPAVSGATSRVSPTVIESAGREHGE